MGMMRRLINIVEDHQKRGSPKLRSMMADAIRFARGTDVQLLLRYHPDGNAIEITDLNAKTPGTGAGTKVMGHICGLADENEVNLLVLPSTSRNKAFYERFGFERFGRGGGLLIRYCAWDPEED